MEAILLRIFVEIDLLIHQGIAEVFKLIFRIAEVNIFSEGAIATLSNRIYGILGVFILFKIVLSAVQYLVNPDKLMDKEKGMFGLFQRTIISIALLALVPTIFDVAKEVETTVAGTIPMIILGQEVDYSTTDGQKMMEKVGSSMSFITLQAFINEKEGKNTQNYTMDNFDDFYANVTHGCGWLFADENCVYDYNFIFSIAVGIFMLYVLLSMGIDIAIRTIKLGILELLAPIPIASYINNQENFKAWYQNAFKVYADLFIRLIVIYFIVYVIAIVLPAGNELMKGNSVKIPSTTSAEGYVVHVVEEGETYEILAQKYGVTVSTIKELNKTKFDPFVTIYIIIGLLMFAKQAPKFICDILGIKSDGKGITDMFKRPLGWAGATKGAYDTFKSNYTAQKTRLEGKGITGRGAVASALKSAAAGGGSALVRGLWMSAWQGKNGYKEIRNNANKAAVAKRDERTYFHDNLEDENYSWRDYKRDIRSSRIGIPSSMGFIKTKYDLVDQLAQSTAAEKSFGATKMNETPNDFSVKIGNRGYTIAQARAFANIQVGTENVTKPDGTVGVWTVDDQARAMNVQQEVEKRTSYLKTADLISRNDATALMNREKTILNIKNNKTSIDTDTLKTIYAELNKKMDVSIIGTEDNFTVDKMINVLENNKPTKGDMASIEQYADILTAFKTGFENDRTKKYAAAQAADARAKKTQAAISNDKKS